MAHNPMIRRFLSRLGLYGACLVVLAALGTPAQASDRIYKSISGMELKSLLEAKGIQVTLGKDDLGNPVVYGAAGPLRFNGRSLNCGGSPRRCTRIDFSSGFKVNGVTEARLDAFNEKWVFGKAYLGADGTAFINFPVNLTEGVTEGNLEDNVGLWVDTLRNFATYIGWFEGS